jgi:predicted DNA-binding helix-hairpin-helix protein
MNGNVKYTIRMYSSLSAFEKLEQLCESARYDVCLASCNSNSSGKQGRSKSPKNPNQWLFPRAMPGKGQVSMLKVLQSNACKNHCSYCAFSAQNDGLRRMRIAPQELARLFMQFVYKGWVHGIFLSTGIRDSPDKSMEDLLQTAEILRFKYRFYGYIHLKVLPGCSEDRIQTALNLANRVSINLESATLQGLAKVAPEKQMKSGLLKRMHWMGRSIKMGEVRSGSQTTQFVVGPSGENDGDILKTVDWLYRDLYVFRSYFSAYQQPHKKALPSTPNGLVREHRLYQSDFLLRSYGFRLPDLVFDDQGNLPLHVDPKMAYALKNPHLYPMEVNGATLLDLLKIPGIGPVSAQRLVEFSKSACLSELKDLRNLGVLTKRAAPWILINGKKPPILEASPAQQAWLFPQLSPESWSSGLIPLGKKVPSSDYNYPGQRGKMVNYPMGNQQPVYCR